MSRSHSLCSVPDDRHTTGSRVSVLELLKRLILTLTPDSVLQLLKKNYYPSVLKKMSIDEEPDLKALQYLIRDGEHVVDIGANMGVYTKYLSEFVGPTGFVYSVEPIPSTFNLLRSNIRKLGLTNVKAINCAVSNSPGKVTMEIPRYKTGGSNFYQAHIVDERERKAPPGSESRPSAVTSCQIEADTADALFASLPDRVAFMKVDVEGAELDLLRGSRELLKKFKPAWLIEISDDPDEENSTASRLFQLLIAQGYRVFWYDGDSLREREAGDKTVNYFFLTEEFILRAQAGRLLAPTID